MRASRPWRSPEAIPGECGSLPVGGAKLSTIYGESLKKQARLIIWPRDGVPSLRSSANWLRRIMLWGPAHRNERDTAGLRRGFCSIRIRLPTTANAYGSIVVNHYYAVAQKNGKTQLISIRRSRKACVNALFPHAGACPAGICAGIQISGLTFRERDIR